MFEEQRLTTRPAPALFHGGSGGNAHDFVSPTRGVVRIVTPGTIIDPSMLAAKRNNFLASVVVGRNAVGIAYIDITTG